MGSPQQESQSTTRTLLLHGAKDLRLESRSIAAPCPNEVQVAIKSTGLCGSDLHYYNHGRNGDFVVRSPLVLGHESSGVVTAVPYPNTTRLDINDRVALEVGLPCNSCRLCLSGRYNICPTLTFRSSAKLFPHADGTLTQLVNHPASHCHRLPDTVPYDAGALIEPLSVCLHAIRRSGPQAGSSALIIGAGAIGLLTAALLHTHGVTSITIADIDQSRLEIAKSLPYSLSTVLIPKSPAPPPPATGTDTDSIEDRLSSAQTISSTLRSTLFSSPMSSSSSSSSLSPPPIFGFDYAYECTGIESCVQTAIYALAPGSKLILVGMGRPVQTLPIGAAALREIDIVGVFRYANCYPAAIRLVESGRLDPVIKKLVTHRVPLEEGVRAFDLAAKGVDEEGRPVVKVVVES